MENDIRATNVDYLYGGGYYVIKNVVSQKYDEYEIMLDIYLLAESIDNLEDMKKLKLEIEKTKGRIEE